MDRLIQSALAALALATLVHLAQVIARAYNSDLRRIPGPVLNRFTTLPLKLRVLSGRRTHYIHALHKIYGPVVRIAPFEVSFSDMRAHREIHKVGTQFIKAPWYQNQMPGQHSDELTGVFGVRDPKKAIARRKLFQMAGSLTTVLEWEPLIVDIIKQTVQEIKQEGRQGVVDLMKWWQLMAADVVGTLAFGEPFRLVEKGQKSEFIENVEASTLYVGLRLELPWIMNAFQYIPLPPVGRPADMLKRYVSNGQKAVQNSKAAAKGGIKTLFSKMVPEEGEAPLPDFLVAIESANVIVAGTDTTATLLTWLVYAVLKNPSVKRRLLDELDSCPQAPDWEILQAQTYMQNVIAETLRWMPPIPGPLFRQTPAGGAVLAGYAIPGETVVETQAYTMHHNPDVWEDPDNFNPDRWNHVTQEMKDSFFPFGGNARTCVGQNIARLEIVHAVSTFFRECPDAKLADSVTSESMDFIDYFAIKPVGGKLEIDLT
ncbi:hypothetical protein BAUCODRAFT_385201 [Baudoinia panamericana UAMH 10762]|uniref:Cytochrome P450 monooxygenase n=1 Tax=Baudoinia panamericana (strain UAMH 10762) TaxID=717646 RepID=M2N4L4_BAUPA|nr:uncharacterized protein BAUCODRAFT_385201 [Baudoinia panamericana UAMH 10762]EMC98923.1 hypothetical protein BAUCODRAFT_385201 [Baudoinia panamericana UAMH 10762]